MVRREENTPFLRHPLGMNRFDPVEGTQGTEGEHLHKSPRKQPHDVTGRYHRDQRQNEELVSGCQVQDLLHHVLENHRSRHCQTVKQSRSCQDVAPLIRIALVLQEGIDRHEEKCRSQARKGKNGIKEP